MSKVIKHVHLHTTTSADLKIIKLAVSFFALCTVLFIVGIFKIESDTNMAPFSGSRDYVVYDKEITPKGLCTPEDICFENVRLYRSGKAISLGSKMAIKVLSKKEMNKIIASINTTQIFDRECKEVDSGVNSSYTLKLGVEVRRIKSGSCDQQLQQIESQIFQ
jgi:hypothetical protein